MSIYKIPVKWVSIPIGIFHQLLEFEPERPSNRYSLCYSVIYDTSKFVMYFLGTPTGAFKFLSLALMVQRARSRVNSSK